MTVLLNKWGGERFEHDNVLCDFCGKLGAVKDFEAGGYSWSICKSCLLAWVAEIDQAVLAVAIKTAEQVDINRELFEFKEFNRKHPLRKEGN